MKLLELVNVDHLIWATFPSSRSASGSMVSKKLRPKSTDSMKLCHLGKMTQSLCLYFLDMERGEKSDHHRKN